MRSSDAKDGNGTQFTCFTGTLVRGTEFTGFTDVKQGVFEQLQLAPDTQAAKFQTLATSARTHTHTQVCIC
jgi:hypothetical protein